MGVTKSQATSRREGPKAKTSGVDWGSMASRTEAEGVTWDEIAPSLLCKLVHLATARGMGISFSSLVSVQGVSITILDGADRPKFYANTPDSLEKLVQDLIARLE